MTASELKGRVTNKTIASLNQPYSIAQYMEQLLLIEARQYFGPDTQTVVVAHLNWLKSLDPTDKIVWTQDKKGELSVSIYEQD